MVDRGFSSTANLDYLRREVSGRSDRSWDDSVRIDVRYVENWTLAFDLMILGKTVGAVVRGSGAHGPAEGAGARRSVAAGLQT